MQGVAKLYLDQTKPGWRNEVSATYQRLQASTGPHFNTESEKDIEAAIVDAVASCNITEENFSCAPGYVPLSFFRDLYLWSCIPYWLDIVYSEVCLPHSRRQKGIPDFLTTSPFHKLFI